MFDTGFMPAIGVTIGQSATCHAHAMRLKTPRRAWGRHSRYYSLWSAGTIFRRAEIHRVPPCLDEFGSTARMPRWSRITR